MNIQTKVEIITPGRAREMLAQSGGNRKLKVAKVAGYARDMAAGDWQLNGEPIIFSSSGKLIDGHHRLSAGEKSGTTFMAVVVTGVPDDARHTIDTGSSRSAADALGIQGVRNTTTVVSIVSVLVSLKNGRTRSANMTTTEVFDFVEFYPEVHEAATFASQKHFARCTALIGAAHFIAHRYGYPAKIFEFAAVLKTGIPAYPGCPVHAFRERVLNAAMRGLPLSHHELHLLFFWAWEKFLRGDAVAALKTPKRFYASGWCDE